MDPETFERISVGIQLERCASCGYASRFEKRDYYYVDPGECHFAS